MISFRKSSVESAFTPVGASAACSVFLLLAMLDTVLMVGLLSRFIWCPPVYVDGDVFGWLNDDIELIRRQDLRPGSRGRDFGRASRRLQPGPRRGRRISAR